MRTILTIYFLESPFLLVLLIRKSSQPDQLVNSPKKKMARVPQTRNLGIRVATLFQTPNLKVRVSVTAKDEHSNQ